MVEPFPGINETCRSGKSSSGTDDNGIRVFGTEGVRGGATQGGIYPDPFRLHPETHIGRHVDMGRRIPGIL